MMNNEDEQWHWQEPETAWKGVGIYHITMVVSSRKPLLGELVIPDNDPQQARVELTPLGNEIKDCVKTIPNHHPEIQILALRMMPDHVHFVLHVKHKMEIGIKAVVHIHRQLTRMTFGITNDVLIPSFMRCHSSAQCRAKDN